MSADSTASALDRIRADLRTAADGGLSGIKAGDYLPAALVRHCGTLLAAVEAALKMAGEWDAESDRLDDLADKPGTDEEARPVLSGEAQGYSDCAGALREAITAALTGKGEGDEH